MAKRDSDPPTDIFCTLPAQFLISSPYANTPGSWITGSGNKWMGRPCGRPILAAVGRSTPGGKSLQHRPNQMNRDDRSVGRHPVLSFRTISGSSAGLPRIRADQFASTKRHSKAPGRARFRQNAIPQESRRISSRHRHRRRSKNPSF